MVFAGTGPGLLAATARVAVSGRVLDADTHRGIAGALVVAAGVGANVAVQADGAGTYRMQLPSGRYWLTAQGSGYLEQTRRLTLRRTTATLDFALQPLRGRPKPTPRPSATPAPTPTVTPAPAPTPGPTPAPTATPQPGTRRWSNPSSWPTGRVPTRNDNVVIPAGLTIEVDVTTAEARTVTVDGVLRASRSVPSTLTVYGNLIVRRQGVLDYGRPADRVSAQAEIHWVLNEANYVGGATMEPVASDVGLWAVDDAQVWIHGVYRDTWSALVRPALVGATDIVVDPAYAAGWQVGDLVVVGPSNLGRSSEVQDETRRIAAVLGNGIFRLNTPLTYDHDVLMVAWTDAWGDAWTERLAAKVINLTANIVFAAVDANHRPHVMFMDRAKHFVEDLAVVNFSPMPKVNPMARYAWHEHNQRDGSRGSYLRRVRLYGGPGDGWHIHNSYGISAEDVVVFNQARAYVALADGRFFTNTRGIMLERSTPNDVAGHAADNCYLDRPLVMRWGTGQRDYRNAGIWLTSSESCVIAGAVATGGWGQSRSSGMHWEEGGGGGDNPYVYRAEAHSNAVMGFHSWQNNTPAQRIVDLLAWRNGNAGVGWGAYGTRYWAHQVRAIGNGVAQLAHWARGWGITGFLADGLGGGVGIEVRNYTGDSTSDSVYEDGVVRNVATNVRHAPLNAAGSISWVQFARVAFDPTRPVLFGPSAVPPPGSRLRFRQQSGLQRAANFTLFRLGDTNAPAGAVADGEYNALRLDNDTTGTRPRPPRVRIVTPDDQVATGIVRLEVETDAAEVEFYLANRSLGRVAAAGGRAALDFDMSTYPNRRVYFWAQVTGVGGIVNTSRVIRVRKF